MQTGTAVLVGCVFFFIRKGWLLLAGYWLPLVLTASITWASFVTPTVGVELLMIPICVVLISIFKNKLHSFIVFTIVFSNYLLMEITRRDVEAVIEYPKDIELLVYYSNVSTVFIVCFLIVLYYRKWSNASEQELLKKNLEIAEKNEEIKKATTLLIQEQEKSHILEIQRNKKDMDTLHTNNQMKMKVQEHLIVKIESILESNDISKDLKHIIVDLKSQKIVDEKIDFIQGRNDEVSAQFEARLIKDFPNLSKTEREICVFVRMNLSTKEIANIRNSSINTINVTKTRLRKKLGLNKSVELGSFLQSI